MKLKTIEVEGEVYAAVSDGKPVYVDDGGKETTYDPVAMHQTIGRLNHEAKSHREAKEELEQQIKNFDGVDAEQARKALETLKNLDDKKLIDAGEVDRVKAEVSKSYEQKLKEANERAQSLESQYAQEKTASAFAGSKFVKEKLAIPHDMVQATFGKYFQFKDGKLVPQDPSGNPIYSDSNPGEVAAFDEALEKVVNSYPYKDSILKGSGSSGSGASPVDSGGKRIVTREQFGKMQPQEQAKISAAAREGKVALTD